MNFSKAVVWALVDKFTNVAARAVQTFALARTLGVTRQGEFALFVGWTTIAAIFANCGLSVTANYFAASRPDAPSRSALNGTLVAVGALSGVMAGAVAALLSLVYGPFAAAHLSLQLPILLTVALSSLHISLASFLFGCARYDAKAWCNLVYQVGLSAALVFAARRQDVTLLAWLWCGGTFFIVASLFVAALSESGWRVRFVPGEARLHLAYGLRSYAFLLSQGALAVTPLLVVGQFLDASSAAIYGIASSCGEVVLNVGRAVADVIQQRAGAGQSVARSTLRTLALAMVGLAFVAAPTSRFIFPRFLGADYSGSVPIFCLLLLGLPFFGWGNAACYLLFGQGQFDIPPRVSVTTFVIGLPIVVLLTAIVGAHGTALGTSISYGIFFTLAYVAVSRKAATAAAPRDRLASPT